MGRDAMKPLPPAPDPQGDAHLDPEAALELTRSILSRTSGSPCQRVHAQACAFVDGELEEGRSDLLRSHLAHCPSCSALVTVLSEAKAVLPTLAEITPGPWFTQSVLRATVHAPRPALRSVPDLRTSWMKLIHRPRICLEAAYLSAAAGMLGFFAPMPNLAWASMKAPVLVRGLSPKPMLEAMEAPARRTVGGMIEAERRTASSLRRSFQGSPSPMRPSNPSATGNPRPGAWQWVSVRIQRWVPKHPHAADVEPKAEKPPVQANP